MLKCCSGHKVLHYAYTRLKVAAPSGGQARERQRGALATADGGEILPPPGLAPGSWSKGLGLPWNGGGHLGLPTITASACWGGLACQTPLVLYWQVRLGKDFITESLTLFHVKCNFSR